MNTIDKVGIKEKLIEAINREDLPTREAARLLNIHPCYMSMVKNEKLWDSITSKVWERFNEWFQTRDLLVNFQIPEGEEIYKIKEKENKPSDQFVAGVKDPLAKLLSDSIKKQKKGKKHELSAELNQDVLKLHKIEDLMSIILKKLDTKVEKYSDNPSLEAIKQKFSIDIEINLVLNGQRINIG